MGTKDWWCAGELRTSGRLGFDNLWQGDGLGAPRQQGVEILITIMVAMVAATVSVVVTKRINVIGHITCARHCVRTTRIFNLILMLLISPYS